MAVEETVVESGMGYINGLKSIGLPSTTSTTLTATTTVSGSLLILSGVIVIGIPLAILAVRGIYKLRHKGDPKTKNDQERSFVSTNSKVLLSLAVGATLMISVGTAMLPRTLTVMIIHIIAGYTCLLLSFIHIFQYRKVIMVQAKKYWSFLSAPKAPKLARKGV